MIGAVVSSAMVAAASLDQSIKQLPTRRRIGVLAYSDYSLVADASNGLRWYVPLAAAWSSISGAAAVVGWTGHPGDAHALALAAMVVGVAAHFLVTGVFAFPALLSQRRVRGNQRALKQTFDRFERWQTVRALIDVATLAAAVWALLTSRPWTW